MTTRIHYYGSAFELSDEHDDSTWRAIIQDRYDVAASTGGGVGAWFDLAGGGHVSFQIYVDTPLAVTTD